MFDGILVPTLRAPAGKPASRSALVEHRPGSRAVAFGIRNARTIAVAIAVALLSSSTAAAASYLVLSSSNTASRTTTLKSATNAAVLQISNTNTSGGTSPGASGSPCPAVGPRSW